MASKTTRIAFLMVVLGLSASSTFGQSINPTWKTDLNSLLEKYLTCANGATDTYPCSSFIGESLSKVYKLNVYSEKSKRYLQLKEIAAGFSDASQWTELGHAYDQKVLDESQKLANEHKAVVAVYRTAEGVSHVALVLPGEVQFSGTWNFKVPNSASFVLNDPSKSYVGKGLSYAFSRTMLKDVLLYVKKY